jgi:hypothetical protein
MSDSSLPLTAAAVTYDNAATGLGVAVSPPRRLADVSVASMGPSLQP